MMKALVQSTASSDISDARKTAWAQQDLENELHFFKSLFTLWLSPKSHGQACHIPGSKKGYKLSKLLLL